MSSKQTTRRAGAAPLLAASALGIALAWCGWHLGGGPLAVAALLLGALALATSYALRRPAERAPARRNEEPSGLQELAGLESNFGLTLFRNARRDRLTLAVTTPRGISFLATRLDDEGERRHHRSLLDEAFVCREDETLLLTAGPDGATPAPPTRIRTVVERLLAKDATGLKRLYLSDAKGRLIALSSLALRVGTTVFELADPLEWRAFLFQERLGPGNGVIEWSRDASTPSGVLVYQATWIRQNSRELVFVALLGPLLETMSPAAYAPEPAPPEELRVAIDRHFMAPLRAALGRAPRAQTPQMPILRSFCTRP